MWQFFGLSQKRRLVADEIKTMTDIEGLTVVLIDMQGRFVENLRGRVRREIISAQQQVISACAERDIPIVILEYDKFYGKHESTILCLTKMLETVPRKTTIMKFDDDGFIGTGLNEVLEEFSTESLLLMGINADACVFETARSAVDLVYKIITSEKLIASKGLSTIQSECKEWYMQNGCLIEARAS